MIKKIISQESMLILSMFLISFLLFKDIYNPAYSLIGDEYPFFQKAKSIAENGLSGINVASQNGVYGYHPMLDSVVQGMVMKIFGVNLIGWKIANILAVNLSIVLIYLIGIAIFNRKLIGLIAAIFFGFSHYVFAFAHVGYNNLNSIPIFLLAVFFLARYIKFFKDKDIFLSGLFSGLCFYTFFSARFILLLTIPLVLTAKSKSILWYLIGFFVFFTPFLIANKTLIFSEMIAQTLDFPYEDNSTGLDKLLYFFAGLLMDKYIASHHFVIGPLLSPILFVCLLLGVLAVLIKLERRTKFLLLTWFFVISSLIAISFYKLEVPTTRLHIIMPSVSLIAAYGLVIFVRKRYLILVCVLLYIIAELATFYIRTPKVHALSHNSILLELASENRNKTVCVLDNNVAPPILLLASLYDVHNVKVYKVATPINENCDIVTNLPHININKVLSDLEISRSYESNSLGSNLAQGNKVLGEKTQKYIKKTHADSASINKITYYESEN